MAIGLILKGMSLENKIKETQENVETRKIFEKQKWYISAFFSYIKLKVDGDRKYCIFMFFHSLKGATMIDEASAIRLYMTIGFFQYTRLDF